MSKTELRRAIAAKSAIDPEEYQVKSHAITAFTATISEVLEAENIFIYLSTQSEPNTDELIDKFIEDGKKIYVPIVDGDEFYLGEYRADTHLRRGAFGIREPYPVERADILPDVTIIPMVAYDVALNRLGHGKGYYDKYLCDKMLFKIGLCFSDREAERIPSDTHDVKMDLIVTEKGIIR